MRRPVTPSPGVGCTSSGGAARPAARRAACGGAGPAARRVRRTRSARVLATRAGQGPLGRQDIRVDLGPVTFARASATLREGRLIPKRQALDELPALGAPVEVVEDIARRRYEDPAPPDDGRLARR